jgi:hypothetical protein
LAERRTLSGFDNMLYSVTPKRIIITAIKGKIMVLEKLGS